MDKRILVWDFPTRIFHWTLALSFAGAYLTAEAERWRDIHVICGYLMLGMIGFRLVWGLVGSRHARFADFVRGPAAVLRYLRSLLSRSPERHVGHNPAGAIAVVLLLALGLGSGISGWMMFNESGGAQLADVLEDLHETLGNAMLAVVAIHVLGVIVASRLHRENLIAAMVTGYKNGPENEGIHHRHGIIAVILIAALVAFGWSLTQGKLPALYDPGGATMEKLQKEAGHHDHNDRSRRKGKNPHDD
ncbi:MAG: cytochrome b/b6 domain-containing protein [Rhodocyclaceae bacterium]|nr:cytochrome b/b6 domain-containing protein [Rhodocyclaceae bacterium]